MPVLLNVLVSGLAVLVTARLIPGVAVAGLGTAVLVAVVLGLVNGLLAPALLALTLPLGGFMLGLFTFVVIGLTVMATAYLVPGFRVESFWSSLSFALVLSFINAFFHGSPPL